MCCRNQHLDFSGSPHTRLICDVKASKQCPRVPLGEVTQMSKTEQENTKKWAGHISPKQVDYRTWWDTSTHLIFRYVQSPLVHSYLLPNMSNPQCCSCDSNMVCLLLSLKQINRLGIIFPSWKRQKSKQLNLQNIYIYIVYRKVSHPSTSHAPYVLHRNRTLVPFLSITPCPPVAAKTPTIFCLYTVFHHLYSILPNLV